MENNLNLEEATFSFSQDGNCISDSDNAEFLEIKCVSDLGVDRSEGCFYILKQKDGVLITQGNCKNYLIE